MSVLEQRYRRLLRLLPAGYRASWEEEMVTTFLASMHTDDAEQAEFLADFGRPSLPEVASVAALAVRLRLGGVGAPPRNALWGNAIRLVALTGLLVQASTAAGTMLTVFWLSGRASWLPLPLPGPEADFVAQSLWFRMATLGALVWLPAYLALLAGQRRVSLGLALLAVLVSDLAFVVSPVLRINTSHVAFAIFDLLPVLALAAFHRDAPPIRWRPWLVALPIGLAISATEILVAPDDLRVLPLIDLPAMLCAAVVVAAAAHLTRRARPAEWTLALTLLSLAVLGLRALTLPDYVEAAPVTQQQTLLLLGVAEIGAVLAVAVLLVMLSRQTLDRSPSGAHVS